jgi:hypothetical protein
MNVRGAEPLSGRVPSLSVPCSCWPTCLTSMFLALRFSCSKNELLLPHACSATAACHPPESGLHGLHNDPIRATPAPTHTHTRSVPNRHLPPMSAAMCHGSACSMPCPHTLPATPHVHACVASRASHVLSQVIPIRAHRYVNGTAITHNHLVMARGEW